MKSEILGSLPSDKHVLHEINYSEIHIVDWKNIDATKGVEVFNRNKKNINSVCLFNNHNIDIVVDAFGEMALPISIGNQASQCECIIFPLAYDENSWTLVIETKYAHDVNAAFKERINEKKEKECYPQKMVSQIISTVEYFRAKNIIDSNRVVHAIISFPNLIADFNSQLFSFVKEEWSIENLLVSKKIRIKGCNSAEIKSTKRIKFITD